MDTKVFSQGPKNSRNQNDSTVKVRLLYQSIVQKKLFSQKSLRRPLEEGSIHDFTNVIFSLSRIHEQKRRFHEFTQIRTVFSDSH